ncbi:MAG: hypothetical protein KBD48_02515 [Candidatus Pacebacteria bacterium]|nr:hypothetical protein [Candidatus Paceibacterota bacterium]MBP9716037.1 hypothetical protein [Candidatus Paceibacterota bacterium]
MEQIEKGLDDFRVEAVRGFLGYQSLKYDLSKITPIQIKYSRLCFKKEGCFIGDLRLEEATYISDAILPNTEVKNVLLEVDRAGNRWRVVMKINFFGLSLCVSHTEEKQFYLVGIPDNFAPRFKVICREDDPNFHRNDNLI